MKILEFKNALKELEEIKFELPSGTFVPFHFHITEVGLLTRHFIDCGGTERLERKVNFQLWEANDFEHRLVPEKLIGIIELATAKLRFDNQEVEIEYQQETIGKFNVAFTGTHFKLLPQHTQCLAEDKCGIPADKLKSNEVQIKSQQCTPNSGCC